MFDEQSTQKPKSLTANVAVFFLEESASQIQTAIRQTHGVCPPGLSPSARHKGLGSGNATRKLVSKLKETCESGRTDRSTLAGLSQHDTNAK